MLEDQGPSAKVTPVVLFSSTSSPLFHKLQTRKRKSGESGIPRVENEPH
jgi:hypothetical protein